MYVQFGLQYKKQGYRRKYAFYTRQAAKIAEECKDLFVSEKLLLEVADIYHLP
jgi:hypothetical protein